MGQILLTRSLLEQAIPWHNHWVQQLLNNSRFYILIFSLVLSLLIYNWATVTFGSERLTTIRLTQVFAFVAVIFLYLTMLIGPLIHIFPQLPHAQKLKHARRALGVSVFYFSVLHAYNAFFKQLGGFSGLGFLSERYIVSIALSTIALLILFLLTLTSFDKVILKMTFIHWKWLHRSVYLAGVFTFIHAVQLGTHFIELSAAIPQIFYFAAASLCLLHGYQIGIFLEKKFEEVSRWGIVVIIAVAFLLGRGYIISQPARHSPDQLQGH